jgi:hypothetical protein
MAVLTKVGVASAVLRGIGAPVNNRTLGAMVGWFNAEGGHWNNDASYNPLNTTLGVPGARSINGAGVKAYSNWQQGINATVQTLKQGNMSGIVQAFRHSDPQGVIHAIGASPWGTSGSLVAQTISSAMGQRYAIPASQDIARAMAMPSTQGGQESLSETFRPGGTTTDWGSAIADAMLQESASPVNGKLRVTNPLADAINLVNQGGYTSTKEIAQMRASTALGAPVSGGAIGGKGDVDPLTHFTLGRTDMGVDANAKPGTPILAPNNMRVLGIMPNWYAGQPYVALRYIAGPNKGKVMYVAEQITQLPHVGQVIARGAPIAVYAPSGTGIEIGFADPNNWRQTLAQATGQLGVGDHSNAPAGIKFRNYLGTTSR